jgi:DNA invertase Pin-like site-specific DNA recombinase
MTTAIIGYARTSTTEQHAGLDAQVRDLVAAGAAPDAIYAEQVSSVASQPKLGSPHDLSKTAR